MLSKIDKKEISGSSSLFFSSVFINSRLISNSPTLLAWCSRKTNKISVIDLETKQNYITFDGAKISETAGWSWTHVKEIPNTKLLVSLHHNYKTCANMEIFDISEKGKANKIYSLGEVSGMVGCGDVTYNSRRSILGAIPDAGRIAYHLFTINTCASNAGGIVKLNRKSKWHPQYSTEQGNYITGFDFNPAGESIATIDKYGVCLLADVNTHNYIYHLKFEVPWTWGWDSRDDYGRCRWSTNTGESLLFVKYNMRELNILDVEKEVLILSKRVELDTIERTERSRGDSQTYWIDVCQSNGNLLASGGSDGIIKIFDKRESKIVKTFEGVHSFRRIHCVRWNASGDMIASVSQNEAKFLDFQTGKVLYTGTSSDRREVMSACFIQQDLD